MVINGRERWPRDEDQDISAKQGMGEKEEDTTSVCVVDYWRFEGQGCTSGRRKSRRLNRTSRVLRAIKIMHAKAMKNRKTGRRVECDQKMKNDLRGTQGLIGNGRKELSIPELL